MTVCILGNGLTALTLAKALVNNEINVDVLYNKKNYKISDTRTIGISKNNIDFFNSNIINIEKIIWNLKKIEIFSENLNKERLINFKQIMINFFQYLRIINYIITRKNLLKNKFFKSKFISEKNLSFLNEYELIINCDPSI